MKSLASELVARMPQLTALVSSEIALKNTRLNLEYMGRTISDLVNQDGTGGSGSAVVIGAGPSLHRQDSVGQLLRSGYHGQIICTDGALPTCLRAGLVPQYVMTLDPHSSRIVRWFGDPSLTEEITSKDDYFRRQELDPYLGADEINKNKELVDLVNQYGPNIKAIIAACVSAGVAKRCLEAGMQLYWWNPLYDDYADPGSLSRQAHDLNKAPCMATGGNSGSAAWVFANVVLRKKEIALVGMDLGYLPGTPLAKTQYSEELEEVFGEQMSEAFIDVENPHTGEMWFTDPTYYWYRETLLQMVRDADCVTYNCTEGGILFGEGVEFIPLQEFLLKRI